MKIYNVLLSALLISFLPVSGFAIETYNAVYFEGSAPITIDGDLSDWTSLSLAAPELIWDSVNSPEQPPNDEDFSATFQCCADANYVYIAINVKDDIFIVGEEKLGKAFWDDSIMIHFPTPWIENSRSTIAISLDKQGKEKLEYYEHPVDQRYPYILEELGVRSCMVHKNNGYNTEVAIPHRLLGFSSSESSMQTMMNVEVFDDDDGEDHESALFLDYKGWWNADWYYTEVLLNNVVSQQRTISPLEQGVSEGTLDLEVVVGSPEQKPKKDVIYSILHDTSNKNWGDAETKLNTISNIPWKKPMLAWILYKDGKYDTAISTLSRVSEETTDKYVVFWAKDLKGNIIYRNKRDDNALYALSQELISESNWNIRRHSIKWLSEYEEKYNGYNAALKVIENEVTRNPKSPFLLQMLGDFFIKYGKYENALNAYENILSYTTNNRYRYKALIQIAHVNIALGEKSLASESLNKILQIYPNYFEIHFEVASIFENSSSYDEAIIVYENIMYKSKVNTNKMNAKLGKARNYFRKGNYDQATQLAEELINSSGDSKIALDAQMIILSMKW